MLLYNIVQKQNVLNYLGEDLGICSNDGTVDTYPHHPEDLEMDWDKAANFEAVLEIIR